MAKARVRRKLAAILSADVEGYSLLMAEDDEKTVVTLTAYRKVMADLIGQFRGRVVDTPGDNLLAEFPSVVDTVQCAVEIQRVLKAKNAELPKNRRMTFRMGINLGDVIEEGVHIYGDGVNIAARIESLAEAGGICLSGSAYEHIENKLPLEYEYLGEHTVKNIARPIRIYKAKMEPESVPSAGKPSKGVRVRFQQVLVPVILFLILGAGIVMVLKVFPTSAPDSPEEVTGKSLPFPPLMDPTVLVVPFESIGGNPKEEQIANALTENVIAVLSKTTQMIVGSSDPAFTYNDQQGSEKRVSSKLGTRHVLKGSVLKSEDNLRITAQLTDVKTGINLWTEQYEEKTTDLYHLLDSVTQKIVLELQVKLTLGEQARRWANGTDQPKAWRLVSQGINHIWKFVREDNNKARSLFEQALEVDTDYAVAKIWVAITHMLDAFEDWTKPNQKSYRLSIQQGQKALEMDDTLPLAHAHLAEVHKNRGLYETAIAEGKKAAALGPNHGLVQILLANNFAEAGKTDQAIPLFKQAMVLQPHYPAFYLMFLGEAYHRAQRYQDALLTFSECLRRSRKGELPPHFPLKGLILSCMELGLEKKAQAYAQEFFRLKPGYSLTGLANVWKKPRNRSELEVLWECFRKGELYPPLWKTKKTFRFHGPPSFTFQYPEGTTQTQFTAPEKVFQVKTEDNLIGFHAFLEDKPENISLREVGPKVFVPNLETDTLSKVVVRSNDPINLPDGTAAYKTKVEWVNHRGNYITGFVLSAFSNGKWVYLAGVTVGDPEEIEALVETLQFTPNFIPIKAYVQHVLPAEKVSWTMIDIEIGDEFKGKLPDDIDTIRVTGPSGDLHFSKRDFYWLPHWRVFWVGSYGIPEMGAYRFTVTAGDRLGTGVDEQRAVTFLPVPDTKTFIPADGATLNVKAPLFSWGPVETTDPVFYLLEIKSIWGDVAYWGKYVEGMLSSVVPEGTLAPGKSYIWRVRVADHPDEVEIDNIAWSEWVAFTMAKSLE
jgi:adenylate cyclase